MNQRLKQENVMINAANGISPASRRYWVVGGKYETLSFDRLVNGTESIFGPFGERAEAESCWREQTERTRGLASVRFTIASEP
jgi:hypothetical protein